MAPIRTGFSGQSHTNSARLLSPTAGWLRRCFDALMHEQLMPARESTIRRALEPKPCLNLATCKQIPFLSWPGPWGSGPIGECFLCMAILILDGVVETIASHGLNDTEYSHNTVPIYAFTLLNPIL